MKQDKLNNKLNRSALPLLIILVAFFTFGSVYNLTIDIEDLVRIEGKVLRIRIEEDKSTRGRSNFNFFIYLTNGRKYKIMDDELFKPYRKNIQEKVKKDDIVTIFRRNQGQTNLGIGTMNLVYQLEHKNEILFPLEVMHSNFRTLLIYELIILTGLSTAQIMMIKKRQKITKQL